MKTCLLLLSFLLATNMAHAVISVYTLVLNGASESPANGSPGFGTSTITVDDVVKTMRVEVTFSGLTGNTTAAHIHAATAVALTGTAIPATTTPTFAGFPLGVTSGSYDVTLDMTLASSYNAAYVTAHGGTTSQAFTDLNQSFLDKKAYLNIHTSTFGGGEIRGFVPEPTSAGLLALVGLGMAVGKRRRHA